MGKVIPFRAAKPDYVVALEQHLNDIQDQKRLLDNAERLCGDRSALSVIKSQLQMLESEMRKTKVMLKMHEGKV